MKKTEKQYSIAIRLKKDTNDIFYDDSNYIFHEIKINTQGKYWIADPFVFEKNDRVYIFYELFDLIIRKGYIAYSVLDKNWTATKPKIIIKEKTHLSFPCIFEKDGDIYIMPESCGKNNVHLYKCKKFPDEWAEEKTILKDCYSVDSINIKIDNKNYIICSEQYHYPPNGKVISCWIKNIIYEIDENFNCLSLGKVISEGDCGIRNAGSIFKRKNKYYRVGQDCTDNIYGKGVCIFEINNIYPYEEKEIKKISYKEIKKHISFIEKKDIIGFHTYNSSNNYEIIDFSYVDKISTVVCFCRNIYSFLVFIEKVFRYGSKLLCKCFNKIKWLINAKEEVFISTVKNSNKWAFLSYIADPFYHKDDCNYLNLHQNKKEAISMVEILNEMGYNTYSMLLTSKRKLPNIDFDFIFGQEQNFSRACEKYKKAKKMFYGVSVYYEFRNKQISKMTNEFNFKYHSNIPYRRMVEPHDSVEKADKILLIGSDVTKKTYPMEYQEKISLIHQSTQVTKNINYIEANNKNEYLFLASYGNLLKGVGPLLEYFINNKDLTLHWIGPIEKDVQEAIKESITNNIKCYGYQDINSDLTREIMHKCNFIVYPSSVEGVPGSVLVAMKYGLIPIVSPWASFDGIEKTGYMMKDNDCNSIDEAIRWSQSFDSNEIEKMKLKCKEYVENNYNLYIFKKEIKKHFNSFLS